MDKSCGESWGSGVGSHSQVVGVCECFLFYGFSNILALSSVQPSPSSDGKCVFGGICVCRMLNIIHLPVSPAS